MNLRQILTLRCALYATLKHETTLLRRRSNCQSNTLCQNIRKVSFSWYTQRVFDSLFHHSLWVCWVSIFTQNAPTWTSERGCSRRNKNYWLSNLSWQSNISHRTLPGKAPRTNLTWTRTTHTLLLWEYESKKESMFDSLLLSIPENYGIRQTWQRFNNNLQSDCIFKLTFTDSRIQRHMLCAARTIYKKNNALVRKPSQHCCLPHANHWYFIQSHRASQLQVAEAIGKTETTHFNSNGHRRPSHRIFRIVCPRQSRTLLKT